MKSDYFIINRSLIRDDMWKAEPFSRGQAWVDMIGLANYKDGFIRVHGQRITVKRGQLAWSKLNLSKRWKWSRGKTDRFFAELDDIGWIRTRANNKTTVVTLCNYDEFQQRSTPNGATNETTNGHQTGQQTDTKQGTNKEGIIKGKRKKKDKISLDALSVDHIRAWLDQKRTSGRYLTVDEDRLLEVFKDYCVSTGKTYKDYAAGFRNAFDWQRVPMKGNAQNGRLLSKSDVADQATQRALARANGADTEDDSRFSEAELRHIQHVR